MAKAAAAKETEIAETAPKRLVCPANPEHVNVGVYKTRGRVQYVKCNDCGELWNRDKPESSDSPQLSQAALQLAEVLEHGTRVQYGDRLVVIFDDEAAKKTGRRLRELAEV